MFGLGFPTVRDDAWINGGSPTSGLAMATGPFASFYQGIAENGVLDWVLMVIILLAGGSLVAAQY